MSRRDRDYAADWDNYVDQWRVFAEQEPSNRGRRDLVYPGDEWGTPEEWSAYADTYLRPFVPADGSGIAVEIGPGAGKYTLQLVPSVRRVLCFDVSARFMEIAKSRLLDHVQAGKVEFELLRQLNAYEIQRAVAGRDLLGRVDLFYSIDSMQHVELHTLFAYMVNATACLKPGGHLTMTIANCLSDEGYARLVGEAGWCYGGSRPSHQFYFLSAEIVRSLLRRLGYEVVRLDDSGRDINFVGRRGALEPPSLGDVQWTAFPQDPQLRRIYALRANVEHLRTLQAGPGASLAALATRIDRAASRLRRLGKPSADASPAGPARPPGDPESRPGPRVSSLLEAFEKSGIPVVEVQIDPAAYRGYREAAEPEYRRMGTGDGGPGQALEDFVVARVLDLGPYDVFVELAAGGGPSASDVYAPVFRAICYRHDGSFPPGLHGERIGGPPSALPVPGGFFSRIALRAGEVLEDRQLGELERVLTSGGRACLLPIVPDGETSDDGFPLAELERALRQRGSLQVSVQHFTNLAQLEPGAAPMFVAVLDKP